NLRLTPGDQLRKILSPLPRQIDAAGIFLAGCATEDDRALLLALANEIWPNASIAVGSDREAGMAACLGNGDGIVVNAGTGSSVTGRRGEQIERAGGWGHILGDAGGAYFVAIRALRVILRDYDLGRENRTFAASVLSSLSLRNFDELVRWAKTAGKTQIAALAPVVFRAAAEGDQALERVIAASATALADFAAAVASRLQLAAPEVVLMGGVFEQQPSYVERFRAGLHQHLPNAAVALSTTPPELGAAWLARGDAVFSGAVELRSELSWSTESPNTRSENLDELTPIELVELFLLEERAVENALRSGADELARAIELASVVLGNGGRVFYVGAGTSGRLGALDAAEIPPTFGMPAEAMQAIIAGGVEALQHSVEGAEDDGMAGAAAIEAKAIGARDLVIGISASGGAAFVLKALQRAHQLGAKTILLTCNRHHHASAVTNLVIVLPTGPEIIAGSTRLKAGTATKVALNIISTGAMIQLGRVRGNLMIDLRPTNTKLQARAVRIVGQLSRCDEATARRRLESTGWNVRAALKE
ncbi:MAG: N-acetylmuramic acid 6-phosphate etherase, partial [Verrucomicrobia bacterium]|nr:N-acetylmuramic acid 6-phosphate etherase [Verrucomicrobiota bacterium]